MDNLLIIFRKSLIISLILYPLIFLFFKQQRNIMSFKSIALEFIFLLYILIIVFIPDVYRSSVTNKNTTTFMPFERVLRDIVIFSDYNCLKDLILNLIKFIPIGFFISMIFKGNFNIFKILLICFFISLFIESRFFFLGKSFVIDNLILNALGSLIGYDVSTYCNTYS